MGIVTALFLLGAACGGLIFGWLGDRVGRVRAMTWSVLCYSLFTGACYFAQVPWHLGVLRYFAALGMGGEWALGVALVMESWPTSKRPLLAGFIGAAANAGYALIAVIAIQFPITPSSWRWIMLVGAAPAVLAFFISLFVPESKRWRESVERGPSQPVREVLRPPLRKNTLLAIGFASVALIVTWGIVQWIPIWADQMTGAKLRERQSGIATLLEKARAGGGLSSSLVQASTSAMAAEKLLARNKVADALTEMARVQACLEQTAGTDEPLVHEPNPAPARQALTLETELLEDARQQPKVKGYIQLISSIGAMMGCFIAPLLGGRLGRRPVYFGLCLLSLVACSILFRAFRDYSTTFLAMVLPVGFFTAAFYGWLPLYLPELFPTRARHRPGTRVQLRAYPGRGWRVADGGADGFLWPDGSPDGRECRGHELCEGGRLHLPDLHCWHGANLVRTRDKGSAAAGIATTRLRIRGRHASIDPTRKPRSLRRFLSRFASRHERHPGPRSNPFLVGVDEVHEALNVIAVRQALLLLAHLQAGLTAASSGLG